MCCRGTNPTADRNEPDGTGPVMMTSFPGCCIISFPVRYFFLSYMCIHFVYMWMWMWMRPFRWKWACRCSCAAWFSLHEKCALSQFVSQQQQQGAATGLDGAARDSAGGGVDAAEVRSHCFFMCPWRKFWSVCNHLHCSMRFLCRTARKWRGKDVLDVQVWFPNYKASLTIDNVDI